MMSRKSAKRILLLLALAAIGAMLGIELRRPPEPVYAGKPLSFWLDQLTPAPATGAYSWLVVRDEAVVTAQVRQAERAIHSIGPQAVPFLLDKIKREHSMAARLYAAVWQKIPQGLRQRLSPPKQFNRYGNPHSQIVWALETLEPEVVPALIAALNDSNSDIQITTLAALGGFGTDAAQATPTLMKLARHPNGFVRRWTIFTLGRMGPRRTNPSPTLITALKDDDISPLPNSSARVRETAAQVLGDIGSPAQAASPELKQLLTVSDHGIRQEAAIALWKITRDFEVLPVLIDELKKADDPKRIIALLGEMGPMAKPAIPAIQDVVRHRLPMHETARLFRRPAKESTLGGNTAHLSAAQPPRATLEEVLSEALEKIDPQQLADAPESSFIDLTPLKLTQSGTVYSAIGAPRTTAALGSESAPALLRMLDDPNPNMRISAMLSLGQIGWKPTSALVPTFTRLLGDRSVFKYRGWQDKDLGLEFVCIGDLAAEMLGQIGPDAQPALTVLRPLLADPIWNTRPSIPLAIWRIDHDTNVVLCLAANLRDAGTIPAYRRFLAAAAEMGPAAQPMVPAIVDGMTKFTEDLSQPVREALMKINPEAAEKVKSQAPP